MSYSFWRPNLGARGRLPPLPPLATPLRLSSAQRPPNTLLRLCLADKCRPIKTYNYCNLPLNYA